MGHLVSAAPVSITGYSIYGRCPMEMYQVNEWLPWGVICINRELGVGQGKGEPNSKGGERWREGLSFMQLRALSSEIVCRSTEAGETTV